MDKKFIAAVVLSLIGGATLGATLFPVEKEVETIVNKAIEVPVIEYQEILVDVPVTEYVNITKEVLVDNENLDEVLKHIYDNEGSVEYLVNDLDDDELDLIVDRIVFSNEIKTLSIQAIKDDLIDEIDGEIVNRVKLHDRLIERLKINDEEDEILIKTVDFEDKDAEVEVLGTFEQDDIKYNFTAIVEFKDGLYEEIKSFEVTLN